MTDGGVLRADVHGRDSIGAGLGIEHQRLAGHGRFRVLGTLLNHDAAAERADAAALADRASIHIGARVPADVHDLRAGVKILPRAGKRDAGEFHLRVVALEHAHGVQAADMGAERAGHPLDHAALLHERAFCIEVVHIFRPVLDGRIAQLGIFLYIQLHTAGVEVRNVIFRRRAALDKMQTRALIDNDECVLKLARTLGVQAEIRLQRDGHLHALRHIHERATGPDRAVQGRKLMVARCDELHKILVHHVGVFALECALHVGVDDALCSHLVLNIVVHELGIVLCADTGERFAFRLRDAETLKGVFNILRDVLPVVFHVGLRANIGRNVVHIQSLDGRPPVRNRHLVIDLQRLQPELLHPDRIVLFLGELVNDLWCQALLHTIGIVLFVADVIDAAVNVRDLTFFLHSDRLAFSLPGCRQSRFH